MVLSVFSTAIPSLMRAGHAAARYAQVDPSMIALHRLLSSQADDFACVGNPPAMLPLISGMPGHEEFTTHRESLATSQGGHLDLEGVHRIRRAFKEQAILENSTL